MEGEQRVDHARVELSAGRALDPRDCLTDGPCRLVGPLVCERVEHVRDGDHAPDQRYALAGESARVAAAVPPLVVTGGDHRRHLQHRRAAASEQARPERGVAFHHVVLLRGQVSALEQDVVGDGDLADVVQRGRLAQTPDLLRAHSQTRADLRRKHSDSLRVLKGAVVAVLDRDGQQLQGLRARVVELARSLHDLALERSCAVEQLLLGLALSVE